MKVVVQFEAPWAENSSVLIGTVNGLISGEQSTVGLIKRRSWDFRAKTSTVNGSDGGYLMVGNLCGASVYKGDGRWQNQAYQLAELLLLLLEGKRRELGAMLLDCVDWARQFRDSTRRQQH